MSATKRQKLPKTQKLVCGKCERVFIDTHSYNNHNCNRVKEK